MLNLTVASIIEKNKLASNVPWLVAIEVDVIDPDTLLHVEYIRLVHNPEDVIINGDAYIKFAFSLGVNQVSNELPTISLSVQDQTRIIQNKMQLYKGGLGFGVKVMVMNADELTLDPEITEYFTVIAATSSDYVVTWELGAENPLKMPFPRRKQTRDRCQWRFKGAECQYSGPDATCDLSFAGPNGCQGKVNAINFGGFPGISIRPR